jgi:hypothetical protein
MSGGLSSRPLAAAYDAGRRRIREQLESDRQMADLDRARFLQRLDCAPFEVTDGEAGFINTFFQQCLPPNGDGFHNIRFTPAQRLAVDALREKYAGRL